MKSLFRAYQILSWSSAYIVKNNMGFFSVEYSQVKIKLEQDILNHQDWS